MLIYKNIHLRGALRAKPQLCARSVSGHSQHPSHFDVPKLRLMTTGAGTVRINPNLCVNGKVCLSILGTRSGTAWSPALCLESLLVSIQSLLCENPNHNEPSFVKVCPILLALLKNSVKFVKISVKNCLNLLFMKI
jgi:ubiquitin-protein ligase